MSHIEGVNEVIASNKITGWALITSTGDFQQCITGMQIILKIQVTTGNKANKIILKIQNGKLIKKFEIFSF